MPSLLLRILVNKLLKLAGEIKDKILSRKHEINGKIVDVKLAVEGKKREEMLDASRKIFVGGLDPTVTNGNFTINFSKIRFLKFFTLYFIITLIF